MIRHGWGQDNPAFHQLFTSLFVPSGTPEQHQWFKDLQRLTISIENATRLAGEIDVAELLRRSRLRPWSCTAVVTLASHSNRGC
jgi:hypothetical protein